MKLKRRIILLIFIVFFSLSSSPIYSSDEFLNTCLKIAESRSKKLAVAEEQINLSNTKVFGSARQYFPNLSFEKQYTKGKTITEEYRAEQIALKAAQPIYQGGRINATYRHDSLMSIASKHNYTKIREDLFAAVKLSYYELLSLKMQLKTLTNAYDEVEKLQKKVQNEYDAKAISELDLIESENFRDKIKNMFENTIDDVALAEKKLVLLTYIEKIDEIPVPMREELAEEVPEISFSLEECIKLARLNNLDVVSNNLAIKIAEQKEKIIRSRVIPNLALEGSYGQGGEAFVTQPLDMATTWSFMGKLNWGLWGNSLEASQYNEKTAPTTIQDPYQRVDNLISNVKLSLLDDINYFIQSKETSVTYNQANSDYTDSINKTILDVQKNYNDYLSSLRDARTYRNEIILRKRKLAFLKKRNDIYEIPTVQLMEESWKYAEAVSSYAKSLYKNYAAVTELERLTLVPLR
ncbi:MAG: TolC family protein [Elusimicrobia bacterium]|nr:TolC family protein [Elusimicrobiota bacterium]